MTRHDRFVLGTGTRFVAREVELELDGRLVEGRVSAPADPTGWMVVASGEAADPDAAAATRALNRLGLGTLSFSGVSSADFGDARAWLLEGAARDGRVGIAGVGAQAVAALEAAAALPGLPLVLSWNASLGTCPPSLDPARAPTLLLASGRTPRRSRRAQRQLAEQLGNRAELLVVRRLSREGDRAVRDWYEAASFDRIARPQRLLASSSRRVAFGLAGAALVAVPAAAASTAAPSQSRFDQGRAVRAAHGDGIGVAGSGRTAFRRARAAGRFTGRTLATRQVQGDGRTHSQATGSQGLVDGSGFKWFINTNITFSTTSSASAAASEGSFTHPVAASTLNGGTTSSTLNDQYDGYNTLAVSLTGATGNPETGNPSWSIYNKNGAATTDCNGRDVVFNPQTIGGLSVQRKVYVPSTDSYARWLNSFTNTTGSPITFTAAVANNLGSDSNTRVTGTSSGDQTADTSDSWVASFQNFSGTTSSDPRQASVLQGPGAPLAVSGINYVNGDDNPWWNYTVTVNPGQTVVILNYGVAQPTQAGAAAKAASLAADPPNACMSDAESGEVRNFKIGSGGSSTAPKGGGAGYCSVAGNTNGITGAAIAPGTFLDLNYGQPTTDPHYKGAQPAIFVQGKGITCDPPPAGYVLSGLAGAAQGTIDGAYPYWTKP
jgi:hypothetical protein